MIQTNTDQPNGINTQIPENDLNKIKHINKLRLMNANNALIDQWSYIHNFKLQKSRGWFRYSLWILLILISIFIIWASIFELDEVTTGIGKVVPISREQIIQNIEPGVISEILVKEGDLVNIGQTLVKIDDVKLGSNLQETKTRIQSMRASAIRLRAESEGLASLSSNQFKDIGNENIKNEINTFYAKKRTLESNLIALNHSYKLNLEELKITEPLAAKGLVSDIEILKIKKNLEEIKGKINEIIEKNKSDAAAELSRIEAEIALNNATLVGKNDAFRKTIIKAPKKGIIKNIRVSTIGAFIQSGQDILEIVPVDEGLLIETRIRPVDIAFLRPGLHATVKISAYDSGIYGWLDAQIIQISPDTIRDDFKKDDIYYKAMIKTNEAFIKSANGDLLPIIPGMQASVDIKTGHKTILSYLFKPVLKFREAFRER